VPVTLVSYQISVCLVSSANPKVNTAKYGPRSLNARRPTRSAIAALTAAPARTGSGHQSLAPITAVA
jgi:hypothetical protein